MSYVDTAKGSDSFIFQDIHTKLAAGFRPSNSKLRHDLAVAPRQISDHIETGW